MVRELRSGLWSKIIRSLLQVRDDEDPDILRDRLIEFVRETLANAKSNENPLQVAIAIMRSVGRSYCQYSIRARLSRHTR